MKGCRLATNRYCEASSLYNYLFLFIYVFSVVFHLFVYEFLLVLFVDFVTDLHAFFTIVYLVLS